ncbi:MAG: type I-U CRISPR-associated protein Cas5/Cas6 [Candidatus Dadabacteria bacterium]|nr:type I-U CRISPR-associated protein Cas5/Cas6 [Candidatus Dadabacteria bacterium]
MFGLIFEFPANRYHATQWGHHVNEVRVPWPPEPWRILRALIASYKRKGNHALWQESDLNALISALVENLPSYRLPKAVVHTHTRHYMPLQGNKKSLVFDAFLQLPKGEKLVAVWPDLKLNSKLFAFASHLAEGIGYLGRAESWANCTATDKWNPEENDLMCHPAVKTTGEAKGNPIKVIAPLSASDYSAERARLMAEFEKRLLEEAKASEKNPPTARMLEKKRSQEFGPTLPELLVDALALDTANYLKYGWNRPPASREVIYLAPEVSSLPTVARQHYASSRQGVKTHDRCTVARYLLAGRPLPRVEDTVKIGELIRLATLAKFGWETVATGRRKPKAPSVISGRDHKGKPLRNSSHSHAFWLPEDTDGDGWIDHITVYAPEGLSTDVRVKLDRLTRLWINGFEWRLALEGFGNPEDFSDSSKILGTGRVWVSITPFLATGHLKSQGYPSEVKRLLKRREILPEHLVDDVQIEVLPSIRIGGADRRTAYFHRFRSQGQEKQTDSQGALLRLNFPEPINGPLCLGYACHFGLGLFVLQST